jgi:hypothetical protein
MRFALANGDEFPGSSTPKLQCRPSIRAVRQDRRAAIIPFPERFACHPAFGCRAVLGIARSDPATTVTRLSVGSPSSSAVRLLDFGDPLISVHIPRTSQLRAADDHPLSYRTTQICIESCQAPRNAPQQISNAVKLQGSIRISGAITSMINRHQTVTLVGCDQRNRCNHRRRGSYRSHSRGHTFPDIETGRQGTHREMLADENSHCSQR